MNTKQVNPLVWREEYPAITAEQIAEDDLIHSVDPGQAKWMISKIEAAIYAMMREATKEAEMAKKGKKTKGYGK